MLLILSSYPRSGRHKFCSQLPALRFPTFSKLLCHGMAEYSRPEMEACGWEYLTPRSTVENFTSLFRLEEQYGDDDKTLLLCGTHYAPQELDQYSSATVLVAIRDPRDVMISYARHWTHIIGEDEKYRQVLLDCMIHHSMHDCRDVFRNRPEQYANIWPRDWEGWHQPLLPTDPGLIYFHGLEPLQIARRLRKNGIECTVKGSPIPLHVQREKDPVMFYQGASMWRQELTPEQQTCAALRWEELLLRFHFPLI